MPSTGSSGIAIMHVRGSTMEPRVWAHLPYCTPASALPVGRSFVALPIRGGLAVISSSPPQFSLPFNSIPLTARYIAAFRPPIRRRRTHCFIYEHRAAGPARLGHPR